MSILDVFCCNKASNVRKDDYTFDDWGVTADEASMSIPEVEKVLDEHFKGAMPGPLVQEMIVDALEPYGIKRENSIFGTSVCSDEINTVQGTLVDSMKKHFGTNFPLGGIGGAPYVGKTGFFAFSHHVPDDGNVVILYGPHVGITSSGEVGKCSRYGQCKDSASCGACVAAYQQSLKGGLAPDMALDMQQSWLRGKVGPKVNRIKTAANPMAELSKVAYEAVSEQMKAIANTDFGSGYLVLVGGIQINMPRGYPDYFLPLSFTIQQGSEAPEDLLDELQTDDERFGA